MPFLGIVNRLFFLFVIVLSNHPFRYFLLGRGPDIENPSNLNINDVLGDYSLTLVDVLDTLAIMGNKTEFQKAVKLVIDHVNFEKANTPKHISIENKCIF